MPDKSLRKFQLPEFTTVSVTGTDRVEFLQGQLTQDVTAVTTNFSPMTGWASAKGRLIAVSPLIAWRDSLHMVLPADIAERVAQRLRMFVLRARAEVQTGQFAVFGLAGGAEQVFPLGEFELPAVAGTTVTSSEYCAARCNGDPTRAWLIGDAGGMEALDDQTQAVTTATNIWSLADNRAGIPTIVSATAEAFVPQMVNLDLLGAISFTKGCYVGQEIVARTQNLGRIKRRMYRFSTSSETPLEPGQLLHAETGATGRLVSGVAADDRDRAELLAVVPIADVAKQWFADEAHEQPLWHEILPYEV